MKKIISILSLVLLTTVATVQAADEVRIFLYGRQ